MIEQIYNAIAKGGIVMIPIGIASLFLWFFIFERLSFFRSQKEFIAALEDFLQGDSKTLAQFCQNSHGGIIDTLKNLLLSDTEGTAVRDAFKGKAFSDPKKGLEIEISFKQIFQQEYPKFYKNLGIISVLISIAPLLGLLGTIYGLLIVFNVITVHGIGDVNQLSGGIAQALITTEAGLIVALPALFIHSRLEDKAENMVREFKRVLILISKSR